MKRDRNAPKAPDSGPIIAAGDAARALGRWDLAVERYAEALTIDPAIASIRVQLGHGLKAMGRLAEAEAAYRLAASTTPDDADIHLQLGHVLKMQGRQEEAIAAYAEALSCDPSFEAARTELVAAGRRNLLPDALYGRSAITDALTLLSTAVRSQQVALGKLEEVSIFPIEGYDAFRRNFPLQPPHPSSMTAVPILIIVDAAEAHPALVRLTLTSLMDQNALDWTAVVRGRNDLIDHSVASLAEQDARISFAVSWEEATQRATDFAGDLLLCDAGVVFEPSALNWFTMVRARTNADIVYSDHDHHTSSWKTGRTYVDPVLQGLPDIWDLSGTPSPPVAVLVGASRRKQVATVISQEAGQALRRGVLLTALGEGARAVHIPKVLCSMRIEGLDEPVASAPSPRPAGGAMDSDALIRVIIPTRDEPEILKTCIDTLLSKAAKPARLRLQIIDNRSVSKDTLDLLRSVEAAGRAQIDRFDGAFNWARINNLAAARGTDEAILVFANNDVEMLTAGWDDRLIETLCVDAVGVVGTRLLYPDKSVQHAGIVLGVNDLRPVHDGLGRSHDEGGPAGRWRRPRQVSAVTGAFMAVKRSVFDRVGGFNERLAIGYNDVDLCLKIREHGLAVIYDPAIELIHHESKTRGLQDNRAKVAFDDEELTDLHDQWGGWMMFDPGMNPQWFSTHTRPFDGLRDMGRVEVLRYIDLSARRLPWSIDRTIDPRGAHRSQSD